MKNKLNPDHSPMNQDPMGRNSMGSKFNPAPPYVFEQGNGRNTRFLTSIHTQNMC